VTTLAAPPQGHRAPRDDDAEKAVLGALLLDPQAIAKVLDTLAPGDFYAERHRHIYAGVEGLFGDGKPIDSAMLAAALAGLGVLDQVGGRAYLAELQEAVPTAATVEHYAAIVRAKAEKRALIEAGQASMALGYDDTVAAEEAVERAQARHYGLTDRKAGGGFRVLSDWLEPAWDRVSEQAQGGDGVATGLKSGFADLDRLLCGLKPGNLVICAGATSMGKTSLAMQLATHAAVVEREPVAVFSLEMSGAELVERMLCGHARVDSQRLKRGTIGEAEFERLSSALGPLGEAPLWIDDTPSLDEMAMRLKARQVHARHGIRLIVVDYLQLMKARTRVGDAVQEVSAISHALKAVARDLDIPVLALSQLSRAPAARPDKRPILSDLRQSGSIEQDADVVMFVYRDDYYNREKSPKPGIAEVIVAKHRNGPTGTVELVFRKELTRFESIERRHAEATE
jgi:replicative DNA helicase